MGGIADPDQFQYYIRIHINLFCRFRIRVCTDVNLPSFFVTLGACRNFGPPCQTVFEIKGGPRLHLNHKIGIIGGPSYRLFQIVQIIRVPFGCPGTPYMAQEGTAGTVDAPYIRNLFP